MKIRLFHKFFFAFLAIGIAVVAVAGLLIERELKTDLTIRIDDEMAAEARIIALMPAGEIAEACRGTGGTRPRPPDVDRRLGPGHGGFGAWQPGDGQSPQPVGNPGSPPEGRGQGCPLQPHLEEGYDLRGHSPSGGVADDGIHPSLPSPHGNRPGHRWDGKNRFRYHSCDRCCLPD